MDPYVGEIKIWAVPFAPVGWAKCDGAILQVQQNQALFTLLGGAYGGDGKTNFALPDFRGRVPVCIGTQQVGSTYQNGTKGGSEGVTLTSDTVPSHSHTLAGLTDNGNALTPGGNFMSSVVPATSSTQNFNSYLTEPTWTPDANLSPDSVSTTGGGQAHNNMQPYAVLNFCIAMTGLYPPRN